MKDYIRNIVFSVKQYRFILYFLCFQSVLFGLIFLIIGKIPVYRVGITYFFIFLFALMIFIPSNALFIVIKYIIAGEKKPTLSLLKHYYHKLSDGVFVTHFVMTATLFMTTIFIFSSIKSSIPIILPFWADPYIIDFERFLFLGKLPHEFIGFLFEIDFVIIVLNFFYNMWNIFVVLLMFFVSLTSNNKLRFHILHASVLAWFIAGNWMAILLASVGPVYYEYFFDGSITYVPLMENLESIDLRTGMVWALNAQRMLLNSYIHPDSPISGISAMPSLHVLFAFFIAFTAMKVGRFAGIAGYLFALLIFAGSVVLGWHYAVDGIVGVLTAIAFWKISHPITLRAIGRENTESIEAPSNFGEGSQASAP